MNSVCKFHTYIYVGIIFLLYGCKPYVCPAYQSAFLVSQEDSDMYFAYFENDTLPKESELLASRSKGWNGVLSERGSYFARKTGIGKKRKHDNYPDVIISEHQRPSMENIMAGDSVLLAEEDNPMLSEADLSAQTPSSDTVEIIRVADEIAKEDSIAAATAKPDSVVLVTNEQLFYNQMFGHILAQQDSARKQREEMAQAKADSLSSEQPDKKWWQFWKKGETEVSDGGEISADDSEDSINDDTIGDDGLDSEGEDVEETGKKKRKFRLNPFKKKKAKNEDEEDTIDSDDEDW